jgi:hypothetical protein
MFKLKPGKSYAWLFLVFLILFAGTAALSLHFRGHPFWGVIYFPLVGSYALYLELRHGIALNRSWRAVETKSSVGAVFYTAWVIATCIFAFVAISSFEMR